MSQNEVILEHLRLGKSITARQASDLYGIDRCAARIHDIRNDMKELKIKARIITIMTESKPSVHVKAKRFAKYLLERL